MGEKGGEKIKLSFQERLPSIIKCERGQEKREEGYKNVKCRRKRRRGRRRRIRAGRKEKEEENECKKKSLGSGRRRYLVQFRKYSAVTDPSSSYEETHTKGKKKENRERA